MTLTLHELDREIARLDRKIAWLRIVGSVMGWVCLFLGGLNLGTAVINIRGGNTPYAVLGIMVGVWCIGTFIWGRQQRHA